MNTKIKNGKEWSEEFQKEFELGGYAKYPNEVMLKVIFGDYLVKRRRPNKSWKVLDVGCAFGNNLIPFLDVGCECAGIDIHEKIVAGASNFLEGRAFYGADLKVGSNQQIPFPDNTFDLLTSINTIHYEGSEENVMAALKEFRRVIKPGGMLYLCTVGPQHEIYKRSKLLGMHRYQIADYDFRNDETFFFFDNGRYLKNYMEKFYIDVEIGNVTENLMQHPTDFLIAVGFK